MRAAPPTARARRPGRPRGAVAAPSAPVAAGPRPAGRLLPRRLLAAQVAVPGGGGHALGVEPAGELLGDGDTAVFAAGAADGEGQVPLALAAVAGDEHA